MKLNKIPKDVQNKIYTGIPLTLCIITFAFTILFEVVKCKFDLKVLVAPDFWATLSLKYITMLLVLSTMLPFFDNKLKQSNENKPVKEEAQSLNKQIVQRKLSNIYKDYTAEQMNLMEQDFLYELLDDCGKIDHEYLKSESTVYFIKDQYKHKKLFKQQYKLLMKIKKGRIKYYKLNGNEIKFNARADVSENKKYKNSTKEVTSMQVALKLITIFVFSSLTSVMFNSLFDQQLTLRGKLTELLIAVVTTSMNYATSIYFALRVSQHKVDEQVRFIKEVNIFTSDFIEKIDNKMYVPKVSESVQEQLEKFNNNVEDESELEITEEELRLIKEKREASV